MCLGLSILGWGRQTILDYHNEVFSHPTGSHINKTDKLSFSNQEPHRQEQVMEVFKSLIFLLPFQFLHVAKSSMVWLNKNGYEDLVVAINPQVPEDANIILNTMVRTFAFTCIVSQQL